MRSHIGGSRLSYMSIARCLDIMKLISPILLTLANTAFHHPICSTINRTQGNRITHRPPPCSAIGLKIDSDIGVGKNWSLEFAAKSLKLSRNLRESSSDLSLSMLSGSKNRWIPV